MNYEDALKELIYMANNGYLFMEEKVRLLLKIVEEGVKELKDGRKY